jgi:DNA polymerase I
MDLPILPDIILQQGTFNAIIAPEEMILAGLNDNPVIQRYTTLYICGNFSRILSGINRRSTNFNVQRAFTVHSLLTILHETYHSIVFLEHDPTIYDDAGQVKMMIPHALKEISHDKIVILYAPKMDRHLSFLISNADRIYVIEASNESSCSRKRHLIKTHNHKISDY